MYVGGAPRRQEACSQPNHDDSSNGGCQREGSLGFSPWSIEAAAIPAAIVSPVPTTKATLGLNYDSSFWTNDGPSEEAAWRAAHGFPKDGYFASRDLGQRIYIVPSEHLVAARLGYTKGRKFGIEADMKLIAAAISAPR